MGLTSEVAPALQTLWDATLEVLERVHGAADAHHGLDHALDAIVETLGADRGLLLLPQPGGGDAIVRARGAAGALPEGEHEEISRTLVRAARESGRAVYWDPFEGAERAGASLGELGILAAIATPIRGPEGKLLALLYVDVREPGKSLGEVHERFLEVAGSIVAPLVRDARRLEELDEQRARIEAIEAEDSVPPLWEMLSLPSMEPLLDDVRAAARSDLGVLLIGESGTGKTALARAIAHTRSGQPVVRAMLGNSDDLNTITSELFGHVRGAFSGAIRKRVGLVEHADGGTLILDEILNLPAHAQQLLLDLTQFGTYRPLGDDSPAPRRAKLRIIAATNGDLQGAIASGRFREDLYYRLAGVVLRVPPLRERRRDVPVLAEALLRRLDRSRTWHVSLGVRRLLARADHPWPGNVRELEALMARARSRALLVDPDADVIELAHLRGELGAELGPPERATIEGLLGDLPSEQPAPELEARWAELERRRDELAELERRILVDAMRAEQGVVSRVARRLGIPRTSLLHRMRIHDVEGEH